MNETEKKKKKKPNKQTKKKKKKTKQTDKKKKKKNIYIIYIRTCGRFKKNHDCVHLPIIFHNDWLD